MYTSILNYCTNVDSERRVNYVVRTKRVIRLIFRYYITTNGGECGTDGKSKQSFLVEFHIPAVFTVIENPDTRQLSVFRSNSS